MQRKRRKTMKDAEKFEARLFIEAGMTRVNCADYFDVSRATLMRALAESIVKFGPLKFKHRGQYARRKIDTSSALTSETQN